MNRMTFDLSATQSVFRWPVVGGWGRFQAGEDGATRVVLAPWPWSRSAGRLFSSSAVPSVQPTPITGKCASLPFCGTVCIWRNSTSGTYSCTCPPLPPPASGSRGRSTLARSRRWPLRFCYTGGPLCPAYPASVGHSRRNLDSGPGRPDLHPCEVWTGSFEAPGLWWFPPCAAPPQWRRQTSPWWRCPPCGMAAWLSSRSSPRRSPTHHDICTPHACVTGWPAERPKNLWLTDRTRKNVITMHMSVETSCFGYQRLSDMSCLWSLVLIFNDLRLKWSYRKWLETWTSTCIEWLDTCLGLIFKMSWDLKWTYLEWL